MRKFKWHGTIALLDTTALDGRIIHTHQFTWRDLPLPLRTISHINTRAETHQNAEMVGAITEIHIVGHQIRAGGQIDAYSDDGHLLSSGEKLPVGADIIKHAEQWILAALTIHHIDTQASWPEARIQKV